MKIYLIIFAFFGTFVQLSVHSQGLATSADKVQNTNLHISELKSWKETIANSNKFDVILKDELRKVESYGQSLSDLFLDQFDRKTLQPYTINLISPYFDLLQTIHNKVINTRDKELGTVAMKSFTMTYNQFFKPTFLRRLMKDQFNTNPLLKTQIEKIKKTYNEKLEGKIETFGGFSDSVASGISTITTGLSAGFGAVAGNISWREGYLKENEVLLNQLENTLLPFDLLMEKKAYKFTDKTIPGHWGHVGVYLGTQAQLEALGLWNHPSIEPFKEGIMGGKNIFQVRRWGLVFDTLEDFINLDEMAILRVNNFTKKSNEDLSQTLSFLADQMDKEYDFSFDAMTGETITCTEIIAFSYGNINWPMEELLGRITLSPQNLAELTFYTGAPLNFVSYITGDEKGMHQRSEVEFAKTLSFYPREGTYKKHTEVCERTRYRHRKGGMRWHYSCEDEFNELLYTKPGQDGN